MNTVHESKVFIVAETAINSMAVNAFLDSIGAHGWYTDSGSDAEQLIEIAGRLCYKSFAPGLNPNVTRIREGNKQYLKNLMGQQHGSVFEHATVSVVFTDVSRILTHELVRHRLAAFSQESQRFVRLDTFDVYVPDLEDELCALAQIVSPGGSAESNRIWAQGKIQQYLAAVQLVSENAQKHIQGLIKGLDLDHNDVPFHIKKKVTSALRRFVPGGVTTLIMVTMNHRMWRHTIAQRTSPGAEEEIVKTIGTLARMFKERYPNIYQDMEEYHVLEDSLPHYRFANTKI